MHDTPFPPFDFSERLPMAIHLKYFLLPMNRPDDAIAPVPKNGVGVFEDSDSWPAEARCRLDRIQYRVVVGCSYVCIEYVVLVVEIGLHGGVGSRSV